MKDLFKGLLTVVEHLAESHTFRSESTAEKVRETLADTRAALDAIPAEPAPAEAPAPAETPAPVETPASAETAVPAETPAPAEVSNA